MNQQKTRGTGKQRLPRDSFSITKEIRRIQHRAAEHDGRIVRLGPLLLLSTNTGDAWILDPADQLAARLAKNGDPIDVYVEEGAANYAIGWQGTFRIEANLFVYKDNDSRREISIFGYPIPLLLRMMEPQQIQ